MTISLLFALIPVFGIFAAAEDIRAEAIVSLSKPGPIPSTLLKPQIGKPIESQTEHQNRRRIDGLLQIRQLTCPSGYGLCNNPGGRCCPLGGECCQGHGCCPAGQRCYTGGCCLTTEFGCESKTCCPNGSNCCKGGGCCDAGYNCVISSSGKKGCCPVGEVCSEVGGGGCLTAGYVECSNDDEFCCPSGYTCYRDGLNVARCKPPGSGVTTKDTRTTQFTTQAPTGTAGQGSSQATGVPAAAPGYKNVVIDVEDINIIYDINWVSVKGSCSTKSKRCNGNDAKDDTGSFSYFFEGSAIYLNVASSNARYQITVDTETVYSFGYGTADSQVPTNCTYSWSSGSLKGSSHTLDVHITGSSLDTRRDLGDWWFELNNLVVSQQTSTSTGATTGSGAQITGSSAGDGPIHSSPDAAVPFSSVQVGMTLATSLFTLILLI
ncbi:hypothetical protein C8J56DRAFT_94807 [Mycena floridula]|nr:hypothetical protein C8J56DRAFT_94807 [Mycena floridula]